MKRISLFIMAVLALGALAVVPTVASAHRHGSGRHGRHHGGRQEEVTGTIASFSNGVLTITQSDNSVASGQVTSATEIECEGAADISGPDNASQPTATKADHGSGDSSDNSGSRDEGSSSSQSGTPSSSDDRGRDEADNNDNEAAENEPAEEPGENEQAEPDDNVQPAANGAQPAAQGACDSTALKQGVVVTRARLRQSGGQLVFKQIKLAV